MSFAILNNIQSSIHSQFASYKGNPTGLLEWHIWNDEPQVLICNHSGQYDQKHWTQKSLSDIAPEIHCSEIHCFFFKESFGKAYLARLCISKEEVF